MWQKGPLPAGTYNWGAVITKQMLKDRPYETYQSGFEFAGFNGNFAILARTQERVESQDVAFYNNSLEAPVIKEDMVLVQK